MANNFVLPVTCPLTFQKENDGNPTTYQRQQGKPERLDNVQGRTDAHDAGGGRDRDKP